MLAASSVSGVNPPPRAPPRLPPPKIQRKPKLQFVISSAPAGSRQRGGASAPATGSLGAAHAGGRHECIKGGQMIKESCNHSENKLQDYELLKVAQPNRRLTKSMALPIDSGMLPPSKFRPSRILWRLRETFPGMNPSSLFAVRSMVSKVSGCGHKSVSQLAKTLKSFEQMELARL
uniref:Uncharacterized protein n=1 Tax=Oryza rufipogon TaxID=4529 RepID=A0A0E0R5A2_ORYRU